MAYEPWKLRKMAYTQDARPEADRRMWMLVDKDTTAVDIGLPGYITDPQTSLKVGDWLLTEGSDTAIAYIVGSIASDGAVTLDQPAGDVGSAVLSVFGRTGVVVANPSDYDAIQVDVTPDGSITQTDVQSALKGLANRCDTLEEIIIELVVSFRGAMNLITPTGVSGPDIPAGSGNYVDVTQFNNIAIPPRGCTLDTGTGEFSFNRNGAWNLTFSVSMTHTDTNNGRTANMRIFNVTDGTAGNDVPVTIGRNDPGTSAVGLVDFELLVGDVSDVYKIQLGNASQAIESINWFGCTLRMNYTDRVATLIAPTP